MLNATLLEFGAATYCGSGPGVSSPPTYAKRQTPVMALEIVKFEPE